MMNTSNPANFTRSASAPTMSAGRDRRESCLEDEEPEFRDVGRLAEGAGERVAGHAFQEHLAEAAEERVAAFREGHRVAVDGEHQDAHAEDDHHLHEQRQYVLAADHAAVEQRQSRDGHENDDHRARHEPGDVAFVGRRWRVLPEHERRQHHQQRCAETAHQAATLRSLIILMHVKAPQRHLRLPPRRIHGYVSAPLLRLAPGKSCRLRSCRYDTHC